MYFFMKDLTFWTAIHLLFANLKLKLKRQPPVRFHRGIPFPQFRHPLPTTGTILQSQRGLIILLLVIAMSGMGRQILLFNSPM